MPGRALVVTPNAVLRTATAERLTDEGWQVHIAGTADDAMRQLSRDVYQVVFLDDGLPDSGAIRIYSRIADLDPRPQLVVWTDPGDIPAEATPGIVYRPRAYSAAEAAAAVAALNRMVGSGVSMAEPVSGQALPAEVVAFAVATILVAILVVILAWIHLARGRQSSVAPQPTASATQVVAAASPTLVFVPTTVGASPTPLVVPTAPADIGTSVAAVSPSPLSTRTQATVTLPTAPPTANSPPVETVAAAPATSTTSPPTQTPMSTATPTTAPTATSAPTPTLTTSPPTPTPLPTPSQIGDGLALGDQFRVVQRHAGGRGPVAVLSPVYALLPYLTSAGGDISFGATWSHPNGHDMVLAGSIKGTNRPYPLSVTVKPRVVQGELQLVPLSVRCKGCPGGRLPGGAGRKLAALLRLPDLNRQVVFQQAYLQDGQIYALGSYRG